MYLFGTIALCLAATGFAAPAETDDVLIVGGSNAELGQFKFMASLRIDGTHFCGGSIISPKSILTAAHCYVGPILQVTAVVGTIRLAGGGVEHRVAKFIKHENYSSSSFEYDVAVYIVNGQITFTDTIQPIPLPTYNIGDYVAVTAVGWGLTSYPGVDANVQQWIVLRTLNNEVCKKEQNAPVYNSQICTLTKAGEGVCLGDFGGPLVANGQVHGIASAAYLCGLGMPDFFTRVNSFKTWISNNAE